MKEAKTTIILVKCWGKSNVYLLFANFLIELKNDSNVKLSNLLLEDTTTPYVSECYCIKANCYVKSSTVYRNQIKTSKEKHISA